MNHTIRKLYQGWLRWQQGWKRNPEYDKASLGIQEPPYEEIKVGPPPATRDGMLWNGEYKAPKL